MALFQDPLKGICPKGHLRIFYPPSKLWQRAYGQMNQGSTEPLPISEDQCDICLDAEEDRLRHSSDDQMCDLECKHHPLKTICQDCPAGILLTIVDNKRDKLFELTSTHAFHTSE